MASDQDQVFPLSRPLSVNVALMLPPELEEARLVESRLTLRFLFPDGAIVEFEREDVV